jgi:hypothetical protein
MPAKRASVSGNVNLAALQVENAANIPVKGESTGLPVVASVNVGALTSASAAASQAAMAAQDEVQRERTAVRQSLPSIFTVRVLGFGSDTLPGNSTNGPTGSSGGDKAAPARGNPPSVAQIPYDTHNFVQVAGHGDEFDPVVMSKLSDAERRELQQAR